MASSVEVGTLTVVLPDPDAVASLSAQFQGVGDALADAAEQLSAVAAPQAVTLWTGGAADAFALTVGPLPTRLGAARDAYHSAATALSQYADQLRPVVAALTTLSGQTADAVGDLNATQAAHDQVAGADPFNPDLPALNARLADAQTTVAGLVTQARAQQSELEDLSKTCAAAIRSGIPPKNGPSLLGRLGHDLNNDVVKPTERGVNDLGQLEDKIIVDPFKNLAKDARAFERGDWSLANLSQTLRDLTDVVGVLTLLVPGLDVVLAPLVLPTVLAALVTDGAAMATGEISTKEGLENALDEGLAGTDGVLGRDIDAEKDALKEAPAAGEAATDGADAVAVKTADRADATADVPPRPPAAQTPPAAIVSKPGTEGDVPPPTSDAAADSPATGSVAEPVGAGQPAATAPASAAKPEEPTSPQLDQLEREQRLARVGELANAALVPDDRTDDPSSSQPAAAGSSS